MCALLLMSIMLQRNRLCYSNAVFRHDTVDRFVCIPYLNCTDELVSQSSISIPSTTYPNEYLQKLTLDVNSLK